MSENNFNPNPNIEKYNQIMNAWARHTGHSDNNNYIYSLDVLVKISDGLDDMLRNMDLIYVMLRGNSFEAKYVKDRLDAVDKIAGSVLGDSRYGPAEQQVAKDIMMKTSRIRRLLNGEERIDSKGNLKEMIDWVQKYGSNGPIIIPDHDQIRE
ncbi:MAG TPA: hypothetical protein VGO17_08975 [Aurantimonas sp.]|nr:hypothetical protein [Aurantimonas sp.]